MNRYVLSVVAAAFIAIPASSGFAGERDADAPKVKQERPEKKQGDQQKAGAQRKTEVPGAGGLDRLYERLAKLDLSADQKQQIMTIIADAKAELTKVSAGEDKDAAKTQAREIANKAMKDVRAVLTPEQQEKLKAVNREEDAKSREAKEAAKANREAKSQERQAKEAQQGRKDEAKPAEDRKE